MATAAASVVLGQPTRDESCSTTAFLLIACGAVGLGGWPYLSHPPSYFLVLRNDLGQRNKGCCLCPWCCLWRCRDRRRGLRGRIRSQCVELQSAGGCGQQRRPVR
jgi:hypothetical protein